MIVSDNDVVGASFGEVQEQLRIAEGFGVPEQPRQVAHMAGFPSVGVYMLPHDKSGNLESLCLHSAYEKWPQKAALDAYIAATPAAGWSEGMQAKARIQSILATTNDSQPDAGFGASWAQDEQYRIPVNHACFNDLVEFLGGFPALVEN